jgi:hypothetical protein
VRGFRREADARVTTGPSLEPFVVASVSKYLIIVYSESSGDDRVMAILKRLPERFQKASTEIGFGLNPPANKDLRRHRRKASVRRMEVMITQCARSFQLSCSSRSVAGSSGYAMSSGLRS